MHEYFSCTFVEKDLAYLDQGNKNYVFQLILVFCSLLALKSLHYKQM